MKLRDYVNDSIQSEPVSATDEVFIEPFLPDKDETYEQLCVPFYKDDWVNGGYALVELIDIETSNILSAGTFEADEDFDIVLAILDSKR